MARDAALSHSKKRKALILPALHAELADVHPRSWKNVRHGGVGVVVVHC